MTFRNSSVVQMLSQLDLINQKQGALFPQYLMCKQAHFHLDTHYHCSNVNQSTLDFLSSVRLFQRRKVEQFRVRQFYHIKLASFIGSAGQFSSILIYNRKDSQVQNRSNDRVKGNIYSFTQQEIWFFSSTASVQVESGNHNQFLKFYLIRQPLFSFKLLEL